MKIGGEDHQSLVEDVRRARSRLRTLSDSYILAADKFAALEVARARYSELEFLAGLLPAELRDRSWVIGVERAV